MNRKDDHATKADISGIKTDVSALKGDISRLDATTKNLVFELIRTQADVRDIKATMSTKSDVERIMRAIDGFAAQSINYQRADAPRGQAIIDLEVGLSDHERRLKTIESHQPPA